MHTTALRRMLIASTAIPAIMIASPAYAQTGSGPVPQNPAGAQSTADPSTVSTQESGTGGLQDIIVTAQKRAENIQDVSIAIQAVTAEGLAKAGITDVTRIDQITPGLTFANGGNDAKIALRGANSNATFQDNSSVVGVFVDGIYKPRASQQTRSFFDVARVEVLKGPQGTLYGRNTLAGAINLYTNAANLDGLSGAVDASYQRFNRARTEGYVNAPLTSTLAVRVAGLLERSDGYVKNDAGPDIGSIDTISVRGSAFWRPSDSFDATLRVTNIRERGYINGLFATKGTCAYRDANGLTDARGPLLFCANPRRGAAGTRDFLVGGRLSISKDFVNADKTDEFNTTLELNLDLGASIGIKSITSYTDYSSTLGHDADYSSTSHSREWFVEEAKSYTQELQVGSRGTSPFQYTVGGYLSRDNTFFGGGLIRLNRDDTSVRPNATTADGLVRPVQIATPVINPRLDLGNPLSATRDGQTSNSFQYVDITTFGVFGQASYAILDTLRLVGGIRYSTERKESVNFSGPTSYQGPQFPLIAPTTPDGFSRNKALATSRVNKTFRRPTYRAAVEFDAAPDVLLFANYSTGFLSGSINTAGLVTDQQQSRNYELGMKSRLGNRFQLNTSIYRTEYSNLASTFQRPNSAGGVDTLSVTGGKINATGVEAVLDVIPIDNLHLTFSGNALRARYGDFPQLVSGQTNGGFAGGATRTVNLNGYKAVYSPTFTGTFIGSYDIDLGGHGKLTPLVQVHYSSSYFAHGNLPYNRAGFQPSYTKTDLRLGWTSEDERLSVEIFGENLENEIVNQRTQSGGDGIEQVSWGMPTNYGARLKIKF